MSKYTASNCDCTTDFIVGVTGCTTNCSNGAPAIINTQKIILKQVRAPASSYTMNIGTFHVKGTSNNALLSKYNNVNWNQSSDRSQPGVVVKNVPTRGNSTRSTISSLRPGGASAPGSGVDVKHNSYARYLAKKKSNNLKTTTAASTPLYGNKTRAYGMLANVSCNC